jgi:hypothetical protein
MASILGPFLTIEPKANAWDHSGDITSYVLDNIARDVQSRLKSRLDTGADLHAATRARTVTVRNDSGRLVIKAEETNDDRENTTIDDLFRATSPTPYIENNKLIFRQLKQQEVNRKNLNAVKNSLEEAVKLNLNRHVEDGIRKVVAENPEIRR